MLAGLLLAGLAVELSVLWPAVKLFANPQRAGRLYYLPAESMLPTLAANDRVAPFRLGPDGPRRGDVIVFTGPHEVRVDRVVGLPGDRVAMHGGIVTINGRAAAIRNAGPGPALDGTPSTTIEREQLPGENGTHLILDAGASDGDELAERIVPTGAVFVLGDNRDRAADSRFPAELFGVGMVPTSNIIGRVTATLWSARSRHWGEAIDTVPMAIARRRS